MNIVVLSGGISSERDVSLCSGCKISNALRKNGHSTLVLDLFLGIENIDEDIQTLFKDEKSGVIDTYKVSENPPSIEKIKIQRKDKSNNIFGPNVLKICTYADVVFIALHGDCGEDGRVQATFDMYGIKYTGSSFTSCAMAMDKEISKRLIMQAGIPTANYLLLTKENQKDITNKFSFPFVLKICDGGSSIGVYIINNNEELEQAIKQLNDYKGKIIVEEYIKGREFSVGILQDKSLPPIEIIPKKGFYNYKNKYQSELTTEICPANLDKKETQIIQELAYKVHKTIELGTYSRTDFIRRGYGDFVVLEVNTLPGMTPTSLLPQEAKAIGIEYEKLCEIIVNDVK